VTPLHETFEELARMQAEGLIRYIGVSNFAAWQVMKAQAVCAGFGTKIDAMQPIYNLVKRQVEVEILPACLPACLPARIKASPSAPIPLWAADC
jgi:aryl-alcohol dehydrogenase-like predicted oxidoreductase